MHFYSKIIVNSIFLIKPLAIVFLQEKSMSSWLTGMSPFSGFQIINLTYAFCLYTVLSTLHQTWVSLTLSVRKAEQWRNSILQKFRKACWTVWHSLWRHQFKYFQCVSLWIWRQCRGLKKRIGWIHGWLRRYDNSQAPFWSFQLKKHVQIYIYIYIYTPHSPKLQS